MAQLLSHSDILLLFGALLLTASFVLIVRSLLERDGQEIEKLLRGIERLGDGELDTRFATSASNERLGRLASYLNGMAEKIKNRTRLLELHRNELDTVVENMRSGIILVGQDQTVLRMNRSASTMLGVDRARAGGRSVEEVLRNIYLQQFVKKSLNEKEPIEAEILLYSDQERNIQLLSNAIYGVDGQRRGSLVVMRDVTKLKKLESVRRDFVANVSHELKTPITSIKGFVETLLDGALHQRDEAKRFLGIISRQADRLNQIVEDLLALARMEQGDTKQELATEEALASQIMGSAAQSCELKARAKKIKLITECDPTLKVDVNSSLLEQALINLIDNGIKYSPVESSVVIRAFEDSPNVVFEVVDKGIGIEPAHLKRVFERFYRVDPARSRQQGGTGLGLSIVKHIALVHGGIALAESYVGQGSKFSVVLPHIREKARSVA